MKLVKKASQDFFDKLGDGLCAVLQICLTNPNRKKFLLFLTI